MTLAILLAGFAAGCVHVLAGPDHLAAVTPLVCQDTRGQARGDSGTHTGVRPWLTGLRWGLGHSLGVASVGLLALLFRDLLPLEALSRWSERAVGFVLVGIGTWGLFRLAGRASLSGGSSRHQHAALSIGVLHGFAGSAHLLGVLPALAFDSAANGVLWLLSFATGTVFAMASFSAAVGSVAQRLKGVGTRVLLGSSSTAALATGVWWLLRPLPSI